MANNVRARRWVDAKIGLGVKEGRSHVTRSYHKKTQHSKSHWHEETFGDDACVYYTDCDDSIMGIYTCPNSLNCLYYTHAVFVYQLHCHKAKKWL